MKIEFDTNNIDECMDVLKVIGRLYHLSIHGAELQGNWSPSSYTKRGTGEIEIELGEFKVIYPNLQE